MRHPLVNAIFRSSVCCFGFFFLQVKAQVVFQKRISSSVFEEGYFVKEAQDGNSVVGGFTDWDANTPPFRGDAFLLKTDAEGEMMWSYRYGGTGIDQIYHFQETSDGDFIGTGKTNGADPDYDILILKTDKDGDLIWAKTYGGAAMDEGYMLAETADGGYIIAGSSRSFGNVSEGEACLLRLDKQGDLLWAKSYGGSVREQGIFVMGTNEGNFLLTGFTNSFGAGSSDMYVMKIDGIGNPIWTRTYGGAASEYSYGITQTSEGNFIVAGASNSFGEGDFDAYVIKINEDGDTLWTRTYGDTAAEWAYELIQAQDGNYILAGHQYDIVSGDYIDHPFLFSISTQGDLLWSHTYGDTLYGGTCQSIHQKQDGKILMTGRVDQGFSTNGMLLIQADKFGNAGCYESCTGFVSHPTPSLSGNITFDKAEGFTQEDISFQQTAMQIEDTIYCQNEVVGPETAIEYLHICEGDTTEFQGLTSIYANSWHWDFGDGDVDSVQSTAHLYGTSGTYPVRLIVSNDCNSDTAIRNVSVYGNVLPVDLATDTFFCKSLSGNEGLLLDAGGPYTFYSWSSGDSTQSIIAQDSGLYTVHVSDGTCSGEDSILVDFAITPSFVLSDTMIICYGDSIFLPGSPHVVFAWDATEVDTNTSISLIPLVSTSYTVTQYSETCGERKTSYAVVNPLPLLNVSDDTLNCDSAGIVLHAGLWSAYRWSPSSADTLANLVVSEYGEYWVEVRDSNGCRKRDTIQVRPCPPPLSVYVPSAFSPDGDGKNESLLVFHSEPVASFDMRIYNRWGELVYVQTNATEIVWNGNYNGSEIEQGVYAYSLDVQPIKGGSFTRRGSITVLK